MFLPRWKGKILLCQNIWTCNYAFHWCCWTNGLWWYFFHWFYLSWDKRFLLMFSKRILLTLSISLFHWFYLSWDKKFLLMFSKRILLTLSISLFDRLIRQHDRSEQKLSLWSFNVTGRCLCNFFDMVA